MNHATSVVARLLRFALALRCAESRAQITGQAIQGVNVQKLVNGIVGVMSYTVHPM